MYIGSGLPDPVPVGIAIGNSGIHKAQRPFRFGVKVRTYLYTDVVMLTAMNNSLQHNWFRCVRMYAPTYDAHCNEQLVTGHLVSCVRLLTHDTMLLRGVPIVMTSLNSSPVGTQRITSRSTRCPVGIIESLYGSVASEDTSEPVHRLYGKASVRKTR